MCGFLCFDERGIRYLSKHCAQRYTMIGDLLAKEQYDVVLLQEVGGVPCVVSFTHPHTHPLTHLLTLSPARSLTHSLIHCVFVLLNVDPRKSSCCQV